MKRILIIEDEVFIANDLKRIINALGHQVIGICYNSDKALDVLDKNDFDLVLLDIHLKGSRDGIELAEIIQSTISKPFIYITSYADRNTIDRAKKTFPSGYVLKPFVEQEVFAAIELALFTSQKSLNELSDLELVNGKLDQKLTQREWMILESISNGFTNCEMANKFYVSENTIKSHIKSIYKKLKTNNRASTVKRLYELKSSAQ